MSGPGPRKTAQQLDQALERLDQKLSLLKLKEPIPVHAVGGYAIMSYGLRSPGMNTDGLTTDIDSLTPDYSPEVRALIGEVADEMDLAPDWLNNDVVMTEYDDYADPAEDDAQRSIEAAEYLESLVQANWVPDQDAPLRNIELSRADVPTLIRLKIAAVDDAEFNSRSQDVPDLMNLLEADGIDSFDQVDRRYGSVLGDYPTAANLLGAAYGRAARESQTGTTTAAAAAGIASDQLNRLRQNDGPDEVDLLLESDLLLDGLDDYGPVTDFGHDGDQDDPFASSGLGDGFDF